MTPPFTRWLFSYWHAGTGTQPFGHLDLRVRAPVLIPRPETEDWSLRLAKLVLDDARSQNPVPRQLKVLDICTGSGCIPLLLLSTLAPKLPQTAVRGLAVDISDDAVSLARENAKICGLAKALKVEKMDVFADDCEEHILAALSNGANTTSETAEGKADLLTSNPPYIPRGEYDALSRSVREFEDVRALLGDRHLLDHYMSKAASLHSSPRRSNVSADSPASTMPPVTDQAPAGLDFYPRLALLASRLLKPGGILALEVGAGQASAVQQIVGYTHGMEDVEIWKDPWGIPRTVVAVRR